MNLVVDGSLLDWSSLQTIFSVSIINLGRHRRLTFNGFWWGPFLGRKHEIARVVFNSRWPDDRRRMQFSHCAWRIHLLNYSPRSNCSFWSLLEKASGAPQLNPEAQLTPMNLPQKSRQSLGRVPYLRPQRLLFSPLSTVDLGPLPHGCLETLHFMVALERETLPLFRMQNTTWKGGDVRDLLRPIKGKILLPGWKNGS